MILPLEGVLTFSRELHSHLQHGNMTPSLVSIQRSISVLQDVLALTRMYQTLNAWCVVLAAKVANKST